MFKFFSDLIACSNSDPSNSYRTLDDKDALADALFSGDQDFQSSVELLLKMVKAIPLNQKTFHPSFVDLISRLKTFKTFCVDRKFDLGTCKSVLNRMYLSIPAMLECLQQQGTTDAEPQIKVLKELEALMNKDELYLFPKKSSRYEPPIYQS